MRPGVAAAVGERVSRHAGKPAPDAAELFVEAGPEFVLPPGSGDARRLRARRPD